MVKHIVLWDFKEELSAEECKSAAARIKKELEELKRLIPGIVYIKVCTETFDMCNTKLVLDSAFDDRAALEGYIAHPEHKRVGAFVRSVVANRRSADFEA